MPAGDTYEMSLEGIYNGQSVVNTYKAYQIGADGTGDARKALVDAFNVDIWPLIKAFLIDSYSQSIYRSRGIGANETQTLVTPATDTGAVVGEGAPPNSVLIVRNYSTPIGRKGTGRNLFSAVPEDQIANGNFLAAYLGTVELYAQAIPQPITDAFTGYVFGLGIWNSDLANVIQYQRCEALPRAKTLRSRTLGQIGA